MKIKNASCGDRQTENAKNMHCGSRKKKQKQKTERKKKEIFHSLI